MGLLDKLFGKREAAPASRHESAPVSVSGPLQIGLLFDLKHRPWGYALFPLEALPGRSAEAEQQAQRAVLDAVLGMVARLGQAREVLLFISDTGLAEPGLDLLPARIGSRRLILALRPLNPAADASPATLARIQALQKQCVRVVADAAPSSRWFGSCARHLDGGLVRLHPDDPSQLSTWEGQLDSLRTGSLRVGWGVDTYADRGVAERLGCTVFQGGYLATEDVQRAPRRSGRVLSPAAGLTVRLLDLLGRDNDRREIATLIKQDVALVYRVMRHANAAIWGYPTSAASLEEAVMRLGQRELFRWACLMLFEANGDNAIAGSVRELALVRARMLEQLARESRAEVDPDQLYLLGVFSLLDIALQMPMAEALAPLRLPPPVSLALQDRTGPLLPWLELARVAERFDLNEIRNVATPLRLQAPLVYQAHFEAIGWARALLEPADVVGPEPMPA